MTTETITQFDVLFALRTGVTVLIPRTAVLDADGKAAPLFRISPDNPRDVIVSAGKSALTLKNMKKEHIDAAVSRGFIMFYEMEDDEVTRNTVCNYQKN